MALAKTIKKKPLAGKTLKAFELLDKDVNIKDAPPTDTQRITEEV
jgi:hypothetical protein